MSLPNLFDRKLLKAHRVRALRNSARDDFITRAMMETAAEQLSFIARPFNNGLIVSSQMPPKLAAQQHHVMDIGFKAVSDFDLEAPQLSPATFDMIAVVGGLNWVNDVPGCLIQLRQALCPDGFFIGIFVGGDTLTEVRTCLTQAELDIIGGAALRVSPTIDVRDAGGLLQRAGFAMPVADVDRMKVRYAHPLKLLSELRTLGETAAFTDKSPPLRRDVLARFSEIYSDKYSDSDGRISATLDIISISGWAPADNQPQPKKRGSAKMSLAAVLK
jgi:NADH dehydrogenase [ubiquinone] 1 alpha subcomplex assembly factor 5